VRLYAMSAPSDAEAEAETPFPYSGHVLWTSILKRQYTYAFAKWMGRGDKLGLTCFINSLTVLSVEDSQALA
jgi:hypothetical protein